MSSNKKANPSCTKQEKQHSRDSLPPDIQSSSFLIDFCHKLKTYLFHQSLRHFSVTIHISTLLSWTMQWLLLF